MNLDWKRLLSSDTEIRRGETKKTDYRSPYEKDYDRIVFSSPFRRLQDKAQVFPLEKNDFVRTRLTHSVEVATIARSIGSSIEQMLLENGKLYEEYKKGDIPFILESAGLAHDLGNPPFGHFGEETIRNEFKKIVDNTPYKLINLQKADLINFDGNCQTIRILTRLQCIHDQYGMHITYATLSTLMKYPMDSMKGNNKDGDKVYQKKFGYFQSEKDIAEKILKNTGLYISAGKAYRHPLAFILESADDIAYSAADLEDGFKKKVISINDIVNEFKNYEFKDEYLKDIISNIEKIIDDNSYYSNEKKIQMIRIYLQGEMIDAVNHAFMENYDSIMTGIFSDELLMASKAKHIRTILKNLAKNFILSDREIQMTELMGEVAISFLIEYFIQALGNSGFVEYIIKVCNGEKVDKYDHRIDRIYNMISSDYRNVFENQVTNLINNNDKKLKNWVLYYIYIMITDYVSGMTDTYCMDEYKKLKGIKI